MRRHEVLQYVQTFTEVGLDRQLDRMTGRIRHQASHTGQLFDLLIRSTRSGVRHHEDVVVLIQSAKQCLGQSIIRLLPGLDDFLITLLVSNQSTLVIAGNPVNDILRGLDHFRLLRRYGHI